MNDERELKLDCDKNLFVGIYASILAMTSPATGITRYLRIHSRMRGAVVARVIPVPFETHNLGDFRDIHKVIRSNRVAFISLTAHGGFYLLLFVRSESSKSGTSCLEVAQEVPTFRMQYCFLCYNRPEVQGMNVQAVLDPSSYEGGLTRGHWNGVRVSCMCVIIMYTRRTYMHSCCNVLQT